MTAAAHAGNGDGEEEVGRGRSPALVFAALAALTAGELAIATAGGVERAARIAALVGLLMAKAALVLRLYMSAGRTGSPRAARLVLLAIVVAAGFAVVLMLEAAFRAGMR